MIPRHVLVGCVGILAMLRPLWAADSCPVRVTFSKAWVSERAAQRSHSSCDQDAELDYHLTFDIRSEEADLFRQVTFDYIVKLTLVEPPPDAANGAKEVSQLRNVEVVLAQGLERKGVTVSRFAGCKYGWKAPAGPALPAGEIQVRNVSISGITCRPL